jgi:membrane-bound lytic murein transglycosylase D
MIRWLTSLFRRKPAHLRTGEWGEAQAESYLRGRGYKIVGRRVRIGRRDELDLVARHGKLLVFVEVKTRRSEDFGRAASAVGHEKKRNMSRAAARYVKRLREKPDYVRFDIVEVVGQRELGTPEIRHIENAFSMSSPYRIFVLILALVASSTQAQDLQMPSFDQVLDAGRALSGQMDDYEIDLDAVQAPPTLDDWHVFWKQVDRALSAESIDELAWMLPEVQAAIYYLDQLPTGRPYADWLRQRLDYFMMAEEARPSGRIAHNEVPVILPPQRDTSAPAKPSLKATVGIRDANAWRRRLASRSAPAGAAEFVPVLKEVFHEEGIPAQLVWLAEVESSFDPRARSPVGATGLFQFMPDTAKRFGLSLAPSDERLVPEKSARAAAQYLRLLHGQFGTWSLALAAYNAGEGTVGRLLKKREATTFEEIAPQLPVETQMYVPKVMATVSLREGVDAGLLPGPIAMVSGL